MTKKKYYELFEEYQKIVSQKDFNSDFYDRKHFNEIKEILTHQVTFLILKCEKRISADGIDIQLMETTFKLRNLCEKIAVEESITEKDYDVIFSAINHLKIISFFNICLTLLFVVFIFLLLNAV